MLKKLNSAGDTIVEILISIAVLSLILSISYSLANRSTLSNIQSRERSEAQKLTEEQLELLRGYVNENNPWDTSASSPDLCFNEGNYETGVEPAITKNSDECHRGPEGRYSLRIEKSDAYTYKASAVWSNVKGGTDNLSLSYRIPSTTDVPPSPAPPGPHSDITAHRQELNNPGDSTQIVWGTDNSAEKCYTNNFPAGLPNPFRIPQDSSNGNVFNSGPINDEKVFTIQCEANSLKGNTASVTVKVRLSVAELTGDGTYPAWHMAAEKAGRNTVKRVFTVKNPGGRAYHINGVTLKGNNPDSFNITSNTCVSGASYVTLPRNSQCQITVEFYPPSGPGNNRFSNAGDKTAILEVTNSDGASSSQQALTGTAVSDRLGPGDSLKVNDQIRSFSDTDGCYNNALTDSPVCNHSKLIMFGGLLASYHNNAFTGESVWWWGEGSVEAKMLSDGNFALLNSSGAITGRQTGAGVAGAWLRIEPGQFVIRKQPTWKETPGVNYGARVYR